MIKKGIAGIRTAKPTTERTTMTSAAEAFLWGSSDETPSTAGGSESKAERPKDPFEIAAGIMVELTFEQHPDLKEAARRDGAVIAIEVPDTWIELVANNWGPVIWGPEAIPVDGDDEYGTQRVLDTTEPEYAAQWCEFRRSGSKKRDREQGNRSLSRVLNKGLPVYGFASDPKEQLPSDFMRVCERHVVIRSLDGAVIGKVIEAMFGEPLSKPFPEDLADLMTEGDMMLARRPRQSIDEYVSRLVALAKQRAEPTAPVKPAATLTLDSIAGMQEAVDWGRQLAQDIEDFRAGKITWQDVDPGVLLVGPPGTGKTTFAKALAGTCGMTCVSGSLGEWQAAGHLGDLLRVMRAAFKKARDSTPSILFIDEIDAFGARNSFEGSNKDYSVQVVNALLELLDGIQGREGVVVVAACNNPDNLDPALIRSGRLDRVVFIPLPGVSDLERMFRIHLDEELAEFDLKDAANKADGRTGADIKRWVRGAPS
jgi:cell division protease FtsH